MLNETDITTYYRNRIEGEQPNLESFLKQVGKTFLGKPIDASQLTAITESICKLLNITQTDSVIDLGCANGLISVQVATHCSSLYGIDLSEELISVANAYHSRDNITYSQNDIIEVDFKQLRVQKLYMYEVLQHFSYAKFRQLLEKLSAQLETFNLLIGSVPDPEQILNFYNTPERKRYYFMEILEKQASHLGNWWYRDHILMLCEEFGLQAEIHDQNTILHTAHYRYDVMVRKL